MTTSRGISWDHTRRLLPREHFDFGLTEPIRVDERQAVLPDAAGLGIQLDWDFIENCTLSVL